MLGREGGRPMTDRTTAHTTPADIAGWRACGLTDVGLARRRNEDALALDPQVGAYMVADGMGGHPAGDVASRRAVEAAHRVLREAGTPSDVAGCRKALAAAFRAADAALAAEARRDPSLTDMGTTLTILSLAAALEDGVAVFAHMGDSRLYALGSEGLRQVTDDHTVAMEMVRAGEIDPAAAARSIYWHTLSRVLIARPGGAGGPEEPDIATLGLAGSEALLLCTDGLTNMVPDAVIEEVLRAHSGAPSPAAEALVGAALAAGGVDNVTVVVAMQAE
jgi:serine/threonine protein phosphatase PrpC